MPNIDLSILNQRQTPAFYADTLANRPAAGFVGRIFVSTNTFAFYRDNGTSWDLIGGPGTGTITGSGTAGTIPLWNGASTIGDSILTQSGSLIELKATGANNAELSIDSTTGNFSRILFANNNITRAIAYWNESALQLTYGTYVPGGSIEFETANNTTALVIDSSQNSLFYGSIGVGTLTPGAAIDVHSGVNVIAQLNQTVATNNSLLAFQNSGTGKWRIGAFYNAGAEDFGVFDVVGAIQPLTVKKTTGQVLIGTSTVGSGKLVVASATGDNGIQIVGATAPSLRIDSAESGPTKRAGFGISTATNNFIQGSADRDFCMFNGSTTASPILFGIYGTTNVQEAARISAARNFLIGTTTDGGQRLQISGSVRATGYYLDGMTAGSGALYWSSNRVTLANYNASGTLEFEVDGGTQAAVILANGNFGINNAAPNRKLYIQEAGTSTSGNVVAVRNSNATAGAYINFLAGGANAPSIGAKGDDITITADGYNSNELLRISSTGPATFSNTVTANCPTTLFKEGFRITASATGGGGSQPGYTYYTAAGVKRYATFLDVGSDKFHISNAANTEIFTATQVGNIIIGSTTDNGSKLQVNGNIYNNGLINQIGLANFASNGLVISTTFVNIIGTNTRGLFFASWYNTSGGAQGSAVFQATATLGITMISNADGSGAGVSFQYLGGIIQAKTTAGFVDMVITSIGTS